MAGELGIGAKALDRADLREQLGGGERAAAWQLEQRRRDLHGHRRELAFELDDRAGERAEAADQVARDPDQHGLLAAGEPAAHTLKLCGAVERTGRDREHRVELVQVPAQPLLSAAPLVDEIVTMDDQQLQLAQAPFTGPGSVETRLAQRGSGSGERVDRV